MTEDPSRADDIAVVRQWESRKLPGYKKACWSKGQRAFCLDAASRCARAQPLPHLSERPLRPPPGGNLLEFSRPRSFDRGALVSSSFPSRQSLGGCPAPPVKSALRPGTPAATDKDVHAGENERVVGFTRLR